MFRFHKMTVVIILIVSMLGQFYPSASANAAAPDEYDMLRNRLKSTMTGGDMINTSDPDIIGRTATISARAQSYWDSMNKEPERTYLWSEYASTTVSSHITSTYANLRSISFAYETAGTTLYKNAALKQDLLEALDWLYEHRYNESSSNYDNWWDWEIGIPQVLNDIVVLLYDELTQEQITNYMNVIHFFTPVPYGAPTRVSNTAYIVAIRGIIIKDGSQITLARDAFDATGVFDFVTQGDGFYEDGSNVAHQAHPYNGAYGLTLLHNVANYIYLLDDSSWEFEEDIVSNVFQWAYNAFEPLVYNGMFMDMVRGRETARSYSQSHNAGLRTISAFVRLSLIAPEADAVNFKRMVKEWISKNTFSNYFSTASLEMITHGKSIVNDPSITARGPLVKHKQFPNMDRIVHLQQNYGFGISMHSNRIFNYEAINTENLKGWHMGDGATYLYSTDLAQYNEDYWATVDPKRLAGTTVNSSPRVDRSGQSKYSSKNWVGGSSAEGLYGIAGMDLEGYDANGDGSMLNAKKSWFMFDDEIVALGAGISDTDGGSVETIIDNRKINAAGNNELTVNGNTKLNGLDWSETLHATSWIHLAGNASGSDIGYYFPEGDATVNGLRETRTGNWAAIDGRDGLTNAINRNYVTLWFDHGVNPQGENYSYVVLPDKDAAQTSVYSSNPDIQVLYNTEEIQAVRENNLDYLAINFWEPGRVEYVKASHPVSMMVKEGTNLLDMSISDPTHNQDQIIVELSKALTGVISQDPTVTVLQTEPIKLAINTAGSQGATHKIQLTYDPAQLNPVNKLYPVADADVDSGNADVNNGTSQFMAVDGSREAFLKFEIPPQVGELDEAKLFVHASLVEPGEANITNRVYATLDNNWGESGAGSITWNNKPQTGAELSEFSVDENTEWISVDIADYAQDQLNSSQIAGFVIKQTDAIDAAIVINSREDTTGLQPYLSFKSYTFHGAELDRIHAMLNGPGVLKLGTETTLAVEGIMDDESSADLSHASIAYSSSKPEIVVVDEAGIITALQTGNAVITVTISLNGTVRSTTVQVIVTENGIEEKELIAVADSYVESGYPDKNNGTTTSMIITSNGNNLREAYLKFDLGQLPSQDKIHSAKLMFWATNSDTSGATKEHKVYVTGNNWDEEMITWNNKPESGDFVGSAYIDAGWKWHEVDITDVINAQQEVGQQALSFHVKQDGDARYVTLFSRHKTSEQPRLVLETYTLQGEDLDRIHATLDGPGVLKLGTETTLMVEGIMDDESPADLSHASIAFSSSKPGVVAVDEAGAITALQTGDAVITVTVSLNGIVRLATVPVIVTNNGIEEKEFIAVADSFVESGYPDRNNGDKTSVTVTRNGANEREAYFKFDLNQLPSEDKVHSAELQFWATNADSKGDTREHLVFHVGNNWDEETLTWNNKPEAGNNVGSVHIDPGWKWREVDVSDVINAQLEVERTLSFHVKQIDDARLVTIFTREKPSEQPRLVLETYKLEEGGEQPPNATLTSTIGDVSTGGTASETITNIPNETTLEALKLAITPAIGAVFNVYEADGLTLATALATGQKVIVTAEDESIITVYTIQVIEVDNPHPEPDISLSTSTVTVDNTQIIADGASSATITVQLKDENGAPIAHSTDVITLTSSIGVVGTITASVSGEYIATITSTLAGEATISASVNDNDINDTATITFSPGAASPDTTTLAASPTTVVANGSSAAAITVQLKDKHGNLLITGGDNVGLSTDLGTLSAVTDHHNGTYTAQLSSNRAGTATVVGVVYGEKLTARIGITFTAVPTETEGDKDTEDEKTNVDETVEDIEQRSTNDIGFEAVEADHVNLIVDSIRLYELLSKGKLTEPLVIESKAISEQVNISINAEEFNAITTNNTDTVIEIRTSIGNYELPIHIMDRAAIAREMNVDMEDVEFEISIVQASNSAAEQMKEQLSEQKLTRVSPIIEFLIKAKSGDQSITINNFGTSYVSQIIHLDSEDIEPNEMTGVLVNIATGEVQFVPTLFRLVDGKWQAVIKRNENSSYTVVKSNKTFDDIKGHWAQSDIELLASKLIINGITDSSFEANQSITRAQFTALLVRALGLTIEQANGSQLLKDVVEGSWYEDTVTTAVSAGLISGYGDHTFRPEQAITRQEMAVIMAKALSYTGNDISVEAGQILTRFVDQHEIAGWAQEDVAKLVDIGLIQGFTGETFVPTNSSTRGETAALLVRLLRYTEYIN